MVKEVKRPRENLKTKLLALIQREPGIHYRELSKVSKSNLDVTLADLTQEHRIRIDDYWRFYPT